MAAEGIRDEAAVFDVPHGTPSTQRLSFHLLEQGSSAPHPVEWLDRLLAAHAQIPPLAPIEDAVGALLVVARGLLEEAAVGVAITGGARGAIVVRASPREMSFDGADPSRLFPAFLYERAIPIPIPPADGGGAVDDGSTLHLAWDGDEGFADRFPIAWFLDRLAQLAGKVVGDGRAFARARAEAVSALESQLIQSDKLAGLGQVAAGIVHEINNPITSIVAYADYLSRKLARSDLDPADLERLARIGEAADRIRRFTRDLTEYARPARATAAPLSIHEVIDRALLFCEHELDKAGVTIERSFGEVRPVHGVSGQLTQVFVNLFTNAAHAMMDGGSRLFVSTSMGPDGRVLVAVIDDGHGIDEDHLPRIFDPFFTTKPNGAGTGLGLSIVRDIMLAHSGQIRASGHEPRGTAFHLELPSAG